MKQLTVLLLSCFNTQFQNIAFSLHCLLVLSNANSDTQTTEFAIPMAFFINNNVPQIQKRHYMNFNTVNNYKYMFLYYHRVNTIPQYLNLFFYNVNLNVFLFHQLHIWQLYNFVSSICVTKLKMHTALTAT